MSAASETLIGEPRRDQGVTEAVRERIGHHRRQTVEGLARELREDEDAASRGKVQRSQVGAAADHSSSYSKA